MLYQILLVKSDEGYSVSCPALPGCASQGNTEEEAIENIRDAITEYQSVVAELKLLPEPPMLLREIEVAA